LAKFEELQEQKRVLKTMKGMESQIADIDKQIAALSKTSISSSSDGFSMDEDTWDSAQSKFADPGTHLSEFGFPDWDTQGKSIKFPFTIIAGNNKGVEGKISTGISKESAGIMKRYLTGLGIIPTFPITLAKLQEWVPGKKAMTLWVRQVDTRSPEQGGKGSSYCKATDILPIGTEPPAEVI
jgi:hypothetical protein